MHSLSVALPASLSFGTPIDSVMQERQIFDGRFLPPPLLVMHKKIHGRCLRGTGGRKTVGAGGGNSILDYEWDGSKVSWINGYAAHHEKLYQDLVAIKCCFTPAHLIYIEPFFSRIRRLELTCLSTAGWVYPLAVTVTPSQPLGTSLSSRPISRTSPPRPRPKENDNERVFVDNNHYFSDHNPRHQLSSADRPAEGWSISPRRPSD